MKSKGSETAVISQSNTVDPSTITAWVYGLGPCHIQALDSLLQCSMSATLLWEGKKTHLLYPSLGSESQGGNRWGHLNWRGRGNVHRRLLSKACHDTSAHWRTMGQLCPWRGLGADAFMSRVFSGPCPLCLLLPQRYNISLWQAMNLIGSYSSLSGAAHQSYCLWVGVLWMCVCTYLCVRVAAKG